MNSRPRACLPGVVGTSSAVSGPLYEYWAGRVSVDRLSPMLVEFTGSAQV